MKDCESSIFLPITIIPPGKVAIGSTIFPENILNLAVEVSPFWPHETVNDEMIKNNIRFFISTFSATITRELNEFSTPKLNYPKYPKE